MGKRRTSYIPNRAAAVKSARRRARARRDAWPRIA